MKTIGLIGGMSWESSKLYYEIVNEKIKEALGGLHSAKCLMYSFDFEEIKQLQYKGLWEEATKLMVDAAQKLEKAGADFIVICTNTMHISADEIQTKIGIPLLHIADATAEEIQKDEIKAIGLLGTNFTMEKDFYKGRLEDRYDLEIIIPNVEEREIVHNIIYNELVLGEVKESSKEKYLEIISRLVESGAEGIILGCTEIGLLIKPEDVKVPLYDTTAIHAAKAVEAALK
ncbi:aspartate/glutamate racemase family protein [Peribacillus alkalitolerans]|uniref:aspartate/glutamate racemase family protein n=1 Tax=Peribacillus alkalitolerans TaxID=1550385 RepID=UPI0013D35006|nr:aspartate/glutamate racemase family protein [Peribacillus alkalitolerans]